MQTPISVKDKKSFINWFLNNYQLKRRESVWILNYLMNQSKILRKVHFVRDAKFCPRSIIISSHCSEEAPFRFYKNHLVTTDAEKSFHDIRLNHAEDLYIQLNFKNANQNAYYVGVLEDNPFVPDEYFITKKDRDLAEQLLFKLLRDFKADSLKQKIDLALDRRDKNQFMLLAEQLRQLESESVHQPKNKP